MSPEDVSEDYLFSYKAQRWLWNESDQLQRRYRKFDLKALIRVTENAVGNDASCLEVTKLPRGNFNKTFLLTMHDGRQLIARLPNPNAGRRHYTTASEVATMDYVRLLHIYECRDVTDCFRLEIASSFPSPESSHTTQTQSPMMSALSTL